MTRRLIPALAALLLAAGCAGPAKLAERSADKLAAGDHWKAWALATKALDKAPANAQARAAAHAAAASIAAEWARKIQALAVEDSLAAAEEVLDLATFRLSAVRYTTVPVSEAWARDEQTLRWTAARTHYQRGAAASASKRPKRAYLEWSDAERFVPGFRDAAARADKAYEKALTRVAFVPFAATGNAGLGREVAAGWRDEMAQRMAPPTGRFTRILGSEAVERSMTVSQLSRISRDEAVRLGREAGAERVVLGTIGGVQSESQLHLFKDTIARRIVQKDEAGNTTVRWIDVPIEVIARVRTVTVPVEYEVAATRGGATIARRSFERSTSARVVWTSYAPEGDLASYALVSEVTRSTNPDRAKQVESRWKSVCGEGTTLLQVLEARRSTRGTGRYDREALPRFVAGAAFVFLAEMPPVEDLAYAALAGAWKPLHDDLCRLDAVDDVDLGVAVAEEGRR